MMMSGGFHPVSATAGNEAVGVRIIKLKKRSHRIAAAPVAPEKFAVQIRSPAAISCASQRLDES